MLPYEVQEALTILENQLRQQSRGSDYDELYFAVQDAVGLLDAAYQDAQMTRSRAPARGRSMPKKKRKASAWSTFLKSELPKLKKKHPRMSHGSLMKKAGRAWRSSPKNPNRGKRR